jgi:hypothetical protein
MTNPSALNQPSALTSRAVALLTHRGALHGGVRDLHRNGRREDSPTPFPSTSQNGTLKRASAWMALQEAMGAEGVRCGQKSNFGLQDQLVHRC